MSKSHSPLNSKFNFGAYFEKTDVTVIGAYRWWNRPMSGVYKVNFFRDLRTWPPRKL